MLCGLASIGLGVLLFVEWPGDAVWALEALPVSVSTTAVRLSLLFDSASASMPDFEKILERYEHRMVVSPLNASAAELNAHMLQGLNPLAPLPPAAVP